MMEAIDRSRHTTLPKLIYSLGIANVGLSNAKMIVKNTGTLDRILSATREELCAIDGVGEVIADSFVSYFADVKLRQGLNRLVAELDIEAEEMASGENAVLADMVFVITGSLNHYSNRNELKELIEKHATIMDEYDPKKEIGMMVRLRARQAILLIMTVRRHHQRIRLLPSLEFLL